MNPTPARLTVLVGEKFACVRVSGRANFSSSIDFKSLFNQLLQNGYKFFVLDLSECVLMDSTFLGVLAGLGLKLSNGQGGPAIELYRPNPRVVELLENLGVLHLFRVEQELAPVGGTEVAACPATSPSREEVTRACLEAHELLMQINPANVARFKDVTEFLAEDLKKLKGTPQP